LIFLVLAAVPGDLLTFSAKQGRPPARVFFVLWSCASVSLSMPVSVESLLSFTLVFLCKYFVLKYHNLVKFESRSFDGILLGYTPHDRSYRIYNFETNTVVESCDVIFDETVPCPHGVFECAGDK
jgi:hypothetical protein